LETPACSSVGHEHAGHRERLWTRAEDVVTTEGRTVVLLDQARLLHGWAARLR
jgi:hypothetical protein